MNSTTEKERICKQNWNYQIPVDGSVARIFVSEAIIHVT